MSDFAMAVHGGAFNIPPEEWAAHRAGCRASLEAGLVILRDGKAIALHFETLFPT